ncbi:Trm112 family protein, partial [Pseudomonas aeruginosa]
MRCLPLHSSPGSTPDSSISWRADRRPCRHCMKDSAMDPKLLDILACPLTKGP